MMGLNHPSQLLLILHFVPPSIASLLEQPTSSSFLSKWQGCRGGQQIQGLSPSLQGEHHVCMVRLSPFLYTQVGPWDGMIEWEDEMGWSG